MKKILGLLALTFVTLTECAQEPELYAQLNSADKAIAEGIDKNPTNSQALEEPCRTYTELLQKLQLHRTTTIDDVSTADGTSTLTALLNSAIKLNLQEFPYDTLKLLLAHGARPDTDTQHY